MQGMSGILIIVVMVALMYFMMIRPQQRQRNKHQEMVSKLKKGDKVITIGRLHGVIDEVNNANKTVVLDCEGIFLTFDLAAIASVTPATTEEQPAVEATSTSDAAATSEATVDESQSADAEPESAASDSEK